MDWSTAFCVVGCVWAFCITYCCHNEWKQKCCKDKKWE